MRGKKGGKGTARRRINDDRTPIKKFNEKLELYYKIQQIVPDEEQEKLWEIFRKELPTTFRITGSKEYAEKLQAYLEKEYFASLSDLEYEGQKVEPPKRIPWYPNGFAYSFDVPKAVIRRNNDFRQLQRFLVNENQSGNISRQEAVSMIPPLLLDVQPHHSVLDMCASPGSKTVQMIEALHATENPSGVLIANDSDYRRAHLLVHQIQRLDSPNVIISNHDASLMPNVRLKSTTNKPENLYFDRVLVDAPCTGDGTLRKSPAIWAEWNVNRGLGIHAIQLRILLRGLQMLKEGGRLVYSTCSLNPIENEAVVAAALQKCPYNIRLVDASDQLPGLVARPGLSHWNVLDETLETIDISECKGSKKFSETMWPPEDIEKRLKISRCLRIYPHLQNTGGFFIAVIQKEPQDESLSPSKRTLEPNCSQPTPKKLKADEEDSFLKGETETSTEMMIAQAKNEQEEMEQINVQRENASKLARLHEQKSSSNYAVEEPFSFLPPDHEILKFLFEYFDISDSFSRQNFLVRNQSGLPARVIYVTSNILHEIIVENENRIKWVHGGVKVFIRHNLLSKIKARNEENSQKAVNIEEIATTKSQKEGTETSQNCQDINHDEIQESGKQIITPKYQDWRDNFYRISEDSVALLARYIGDSRTIEIGFDDFEVLIKTAYPKFDMLKSDRLKETLRSREMGFYIAKFDFSNEPRAKIQISMALPLWRAQNSCNVMIARHKKEAIALRLFGKDFEMPKQDKLQQDTAAAQTNRNGEGNSDISDE